MKEFSHFNDAGRAKMVDVSRKSETTRTALASGRVFVNPGTFDMIKSGGMKKGDVLGTAQIGAIMAAKNASGIIPMCHPIFISGIDINFELNEDAHSVDIFATAACFGTTGVEIEALTAVSVAALTIYDMCKAVQKDIVITDIKLLKKTGGKSGDFVRED